MKIQRVREDEGEVLYENETIDMFNDITKDNYVPVQLLRNDLIFTLSSSELLKMETLDHLRFWSFVILKFYLQFKNYVNK